MFIEPGWQHSVVALLTVINAISGAPANTVPLAPLNAHDIVEIGQALRTGTYQPAKWFGAQGPRPLIPAMSMQVPAIEPVARYDVMVAASELSGMEMVSSRSGGILYEDPFYALLASFNFGQYLEPWAEILVLNRAAAWQQRTTILGELANGTYRPERYFHRAGPVMAKPDEPYLSVHWMSGRELSRLEDSGWAGASLGGGSVRRYLLYKYKMPTAPAKAP